MNTERKKLIRRLVLRAANACAPYGITENILFDSVETSIRPSILRDELREVIANCEEFALVKVFRNDDQESTIKITSEGKSELR